MILIKTIKKHVEELSSVKIDVSSFSYKNVMESLLFLKNNNFSYILYEDYILEIRPNFGDKIDQECFLNAKRAKKSSSFKEYVENSSIDVTSMPECEKQFLRGYLDPQNNKLKL